MRWFIIVNTITFLLRKVDRKDAAKIIETTYAGYTIRKMRSDAGIKKVKSGEKK